jgi:hypothetical protein
MRTIHDSSELADKPGRVPPWLAPLGGEIFIHGRGAKTDWTWCCIALENDDIEELYNVVPIGTPVSINQARLPAPLFDFGPPS